LKEFKPIGPIGNDREEVIWQPREGFGFQHPEPKIVEMTDEQNALILKGMWGVVNNGGTAGSVKMANLEIAGKTGTAQNSELGSGGAKDHAWFVSFAPAYKPEIAVLAMIENSGFGAANAGPAAKGIYEAYLLKKGIGPVDNQQVAKK
jgi:cell division protein FtsI/penicillin-binding protein 2